MFLNGYPYTDFHEMNLDFLLKSMETLKQAFASFTASNSLIFAEPLLHDITSTYAKNTIVLDSDGNAYISLQNVPAGVQLSNADYWLMVFNFESYTEKANKNFTNNYLRDTTRAPQAYAVGDWLVLDDVLYTVTQAIAADDLIVPGTNITHFTVEQFLKDFIQTVNQTLNNYSLTIQQYKNDIDASELQYKNEIDASEYAYRQQLALDIANTTASLQAQFDAAISGVTVDSEVINARVGADGVTYATLGDAIRTQVGNLINDDKYSLYTKIDKYAIEDDFENDLNHPSLWESGAFILGTGGKVANANSLRVKEYIPTNIETIMLDKNTDLANNRFILFAYAADDSYIGARYQNGWSTSNADRFTVLNFAAIVAAYPTYKFKISMYTFTNTSLFNMIHFYVKTNNVALMSNIGYTNTCGIINLNFEVGAINVFTGLDEAGVDKARTGFIKFSNDTDVITFSSLGGFIVLYYDANYSYLGRNSSTWITTSISDFHKAFPTAAYYRILVSKGTESLFKVIYNVTVSQKQYFVNTEIAKKSLLVIGDSISDNTLTQYANRYYYDWLEDLDLMTIYNDGKSGSGFVRVYGGTPNIVTRIPAYTFKAPDYTIIFAGTNDWYGDSGEGACDLGVPSDTSGSTFYGAVDTAFNEIITKYPNTRVVIATPLRRLGDTTPNARGNTLKEFAEALEVKAAKYGFEILDLFNHGGFNVNISNDRTNYFTNGSDALDGTHPNELGHMRLYYKFKNVLPNA